MNKKRQPKLYAVLCTVSQIWSPASASVTVAREAPAVFFQGKKIKITVYFYSENSFRIHPPLLSASWFFVLLVLLENRKLLNCLVSCVRSRSCFSPLYIALIHCCLLFSTGTSVSNRFQCCTSSSDPVQSCPADPDIRWVLSFCSNHFYISILPITSPGTVQNHTLLSPSEKHKLCRGRS